ncbi:MAG TPA: hypothetical protein VFV38_08985 [Ktedonobacteraceae bacterium]|nr:hypothetical protein [Ktedonobacteraceae bacterium]
MSMDQKDQAALQSEKIVGAASPTDEKQETLDAAPPEPLIVDVQGLLREVAGQIGEETGQITVHRDLSTLLERMKDGVTIQLSLSRPRFFKKLTEQDLGLQFGGELATSSKAMKVIGDYFQLGRRSLLPKTWQERLNNVENSARYCLKRHSLKSHWGAFVPVREYQAWKEENAEIEQEFWQIRVDLLAQYDTIKEEVVNDFQELAEDSWRRILIGSSLADPSNVEQEVLLQLLQRLHAGDGKEAFIEAYMKTIRKTLPTALELEESFRYNVEIGIIPLPSLLAQDIKQADTVYQERALRDARVQAELDRMERERLEAMREISAKEQLEREKRYLQLQAEQETMRLRQQMERDVVANARAEKERLVREFYASVVEQINRLIRDVTENVLDSIDEHGGIIRGPVSSQLRNLVNQLNRMNFMNDVELTRQMEQIQSIIPTDTERDQARRGLARIDTTQMQRVIRQVHDRADELLLNLDSAEGPRRTRGAAPLLDDSQLIDLSGARKARPGTAALGKTRGKSAPRRTRSEEE